MIRRDQNAATFRAQVRVYLAPVNKYGDVLSEDGENEFSYTVTLKGSLAEIVARLELMKDPSLASRIASVSDSDKL